jgi:cytidine deaminase
MPKAPPDVNALLRAARAVRKRAYAPYSKYLVGAAVITPGGKVYAGCNVENASYGLCLCAERNALGQAIAAGETMFTMIAITAAGPAPVPPCGMCRQVMSELMGPDGLVVCENQERERATFRVSDLLPAAFTPKFL